MHSSKPLQNGTLKLFHGGASEVFAHDIGHVLGITPGECARKQFSDGELWFKFGENIRGADVYLVQSTHAPAEQLMELLIMCDAARRASAGRINAVIPYFGYARQDRKDQPRVAITAKLIANMLVAAGAQRVISMDMHAPQIQGFFDIPLEHLYSAPLITEVITGLRIADLTLVSPDVGGTNIARSFAKRLHAPLALIDKRRTQHNVVDDMRVIGDVRGRHCLLVDDMCDTGGTLARASAKLMEAGARSVRAYFTHAVLSGDAIQALADSPIEEIMCADTIPLRVNLSGLRVISVAPLFAKAIQGVHRDESISSLFI